LLSDGLLKTVGRLRKHDDSLRNDPVNKFRVFAAAWLLLPLVFSVIQLKVAGLCPACFSSMALLAVNACPRLRTETVVGLSGSRRRFGFLIAAAAFVFVGRSGIAFAPLPGVDCCSVGGDGGLWFCVDTMGKPLSLY